MLLCYQHVASDIAITNQFTISLYYPVNHQRYDYVSDPSVVPLTKRIANFFQSIFCVRQN